MAYDSAAARNNMVESQVRPSDVTDHTIHDAMHAVQRERFCPVDQLALAYADAEIPYAPGRRLMRPREVAKLLQALHARPGEHALAISAPYAAAVLDAMGLTVDQVDAADFAVTAARYDVVICEGAVSTAPDSWVKALAPGGRLAVVERDGAIGKAKLYVSTDGRTAVRDVFDATAAIMAGFESRPVFAF